MTTTWRFTFEVSVTDPTVSVTSVNLPNTDYTAVDLMLTDVEANLTAVFNMSLEEFIAAFDAGTIVLCSQSVNRHMGYGKCLHG